MGKDSHENSKRQRTGINLSRSFPKTLYSIEDIHQHNDRIIKNYEESLLKFTTEKLKIETLLYDNKPDESLVRKILNDPNVDFSCSDQEKILNIYFQLDSELQDLFKNHPDFPEDLGKVIKEEEERRDDAWHLEELTYV